jgi:naringenin degradation protein FdeC
MNILGIERIVYGVADMALATQFHDDWGLDRAERGTSGAEYRLPDNTSIHLRKADDGALPPARIDWAPLNDSTAREVIWGVDNADTLEGIGAEISKDRDARRDNRGLLHAVDDDGYHVGFMVTGRVPVDWLLPETNAPGSQARVNRPADGTIIRKVGPARMGHVVYWSPNDFRRAAKFYLDRLGFRLTDDMGKGGLFMRAAGSTDHHTLLLQNGAATGFQHVAYEYKDFDDVMLLGAQVEAKGWKTNVGPLRHNVGGSMSWYIWNPAGGLSEAYCDMDVATDDWQVRYFRPGEDPSFYGSSWRARPEQVGVGPGSWKDEITAPAFPAPRAETV